LAIDREETLKKAEKLLRQGRLDGAIAEYVRVVEEQPRDWATANTLGDLYVRANQPDKAAAQYGRIADHFFREGFYPKAAALYKKILKILPDHEPTQLSLGDTSAKQGLLADAKTQLAAVAARRRARGDARGADDIVIKLAEIDPSDIDARIGAARLLAQRGDNEPAAARFRHLHADLLEKGRSADALEALREAVRLDPKDVGSRAALAKAALEAGDSEAAKGYLDRDTAGADPALLMALADIELRSGNLDQARVLLTQLFGLDRGRRLAVVELAWTLAPASPEAAFVCVEAAVDASISVDEFDDAAAILQEFVMRQPGHIASLLKLVEVSVDGGLESTMYEAQAQLADAYLAAGKGTEARVIAEDLVAREPWEAAHIERFRRALVMLRVSEPDSVIAERLGGQTPFVATDHFADPSQASAAPGESVACGEQRAATPSERAIAEPPPVVAAGASPERERSAPASLDEVFTGIREDASRAAGAEDPAQQLKLGDTYLEMGMVDEAAEALKAASRTPRFRFEAASKLARLYRERGDTEHALEWFERAAEAPAPTADEGHALLYDLAVTLEDVGESARALAICLELLAETGAYRDVSDRADRLTRVQTGG
jgi:tetratricopeptide (TPR) repeat protein